MLLTNVSSDVKQAVSVQKAKFVETLESVKFHPRKKSDATLIATAHPAKNAWAESVNNNPL